MPIMGDMDVDGVVSPFEAESALQQTLGIGVNIGY